MVTTIVLSFLTGVVGGNGIPHFIKGITRETYPTVFGKGPVTNFIVGWLSIVITCVLVHFANISRQPVPATVAILIGLLLIGLFHAGPGAFGRKSKQ